METKEAKVVLLPTKDYTNINMLIDPKGNTGLVYAHDHSGSTLNCQHLYFVIDEEIKVGDYFIAHNIDVFQCKAIINDTPYLHTKVTAPFHRKDCKKVVASTDKTLKIFTNRGRHEMEMFDRSGEPYPKNPIGWYRTLPNPFENFVKDYCKFNGIDTVKLAWIEEVKSIDCKKTQQGMGKECTIPSCTCPRIVNQPDVDRNNTVIVYYSKQDSWNKEEVEKLCRAAYEEGRIKGYHDIPSILSEEWLRKNL